MNFSLQPHYLCLRGGALCTSDSACSHHLELHLDFPGPPSVCFLDFFCVVFAKLLCRWHMKWLTRVLAVKSGGYLGLV